MGLVPAQASAFALVGEEGPQLVIPAVEASIRCPLLLCRGAGSLLRPSASGLSVPLSQEKTDRQVVLRLP